MSEMSAHAGILNVAEEKRKLDKIAAATAAVYAINPLYSHLYEAALRTFAPWLKNGRALELGGGKGDFSRYLLNVFDAVDIVEGSGLFCETLRQMNHPGLHVIESLFEQFQPERRYDAVIASFVNEHIADTSVIYRIARQALKPGGSLFLIVPNRSALSRQFAQAMGMIEGLDDLTRNDLRSGHRRTYDIGELRKEVEANSFSVVSDGGLLFKPFADFQLTRWLKNGELTRKHLLGLEKLGRQYPELCMANYAVAQITA